MRIASKLVAGGGGLAPALVRRAPFVALDWDTRQKSRFEARDSNGDALGVFLPRGRSVRGGDVLVCDDGTLVAVRASPQPVLAVTAGPGGSALDLLRAAYHLGNRHVPLEVTAVRLQFEPDHVLAAMLRRMGLQVDAVEAAFEPEAGAYGEPAGHDHGHDPAHPHDHGHA